MHRHDRSLKFDVHKPMPFLYMVFDSSPKSGPKSISRLSKDLLRSCFCCSLIANQPKSKEHRQ